MKQNNRPARGSTPQQPNIWLSFDVEADGPAPNLGSMVSIGIVDIENPDKTFYAEIAPICDAFVPAALAVSGFTREQTLAFAPAQDVMKKLGDWVAQNYPGRRVVMWSDNPGFDWQFLNYYCHRYLGHNPFGHSCRRIGDLWAGLNRNPRNDSGWKRLRTTTHTHNALDDAMGNAGAFRNFALAQTKPTPPKAS